MPYSSGRRRRLLRLGGPVLAFAAALPAILMPAAAAAAGVLWSAKVVDEDQRPIAGARIELQRAEAPFERARRRFAGEPEPPPVASATSAGDGSFAIDVPAGPLFVLRIRAEGFHEWVEPRPSIGADRLPEARILRRAEDRALRIVDAKGTGLDGARLVVRDGEPGGATAIAAADGVAELPPGALLFPTWVLPPPGRPDLLPTGLVPNAESPPSVVLPAARPRTLRVLGVDGRPAADVLIGLGAAAPWVDMTLAVTGEDGRAVVPAPLLGEPLALRLQAADASWATVEVPPAAADETRADDDEAESSRPAPIEVTLRPPTRIDVRVLAAPSGPAVPGAIAWWQPDRTEATDDDGFATFRLPFAVPQQGGMRLVVAADGFEGDGVKPAAAGELTVVRLQRSASMSGRIVDEAGRAVEGAVVMATVRREMGVGPRPGSVVGVSDAAGRFRLADLLTGSRYELRIEHPGFAPATRLEHTLEPGEQRGGVEIALALGRTAVAHVLDPAGNAVEGASLRLTAHDRADGEIGGGGPQPCGPDGACTVGDLPSGVFDLHATAPGHAPAVMRSVVVPEVTSGPAELGTIYLEPEAQLAGRVLDAAGTPVAGAEVWPEPSSPYSDDGEPLPASVHSTADGRFRLGGLAPGRQVDLVVQAEGFPPTVLHGVEAPADGLEAMLAPPATVSGGVVDAAGRPVAGITVWADRSPLHEPVLWRTEDAHARSADDGTFELGGLAAGTLEVATFGRAGRASAVVVLRPGEHLEGVRLIVPGAEDGVEVSGRVVDPDGLPLAGVSVMLLVRSPDARGNHSSGFGTETDGDGRFEIQANDALPPDRSGVQAVLRAARPGFVETRRALDVGSLAARAVHEIEIVLTPGAASVSGRVLGSDGSIVVGAVLSLDRRPVDIVYPRSGYRETESDAEGRFRLEGVQPGDYALTVRHADWINRVTGDPIHVDTEPIEGLDVVLQRGAVLHGRVLGLDESELAGIRVRAVNRDLPQLGSLDTYSDVAGRYRLPGAPPGRWTLSARTGRADRQVLRQVVVAEGQGEVEADLVFRAGADLSGELRVNGELRAGAQLQVSGEQGLVRTVTDQQGRFRFPDLPLGTHTLLVATPRYRLAVELEGDRELRLDLPAASVTGRVTDGAGHPITATLELSRGEPQATNVVVERSSAFQAEVVAGSYRMLVTAPGFRPVDQPLVLTAGGPPIVLDLVLQADGGELAP